MLHYTRCVGLVASLAAFKLRSWVCSQDLGQELQKACALLREALEAPSLDTFQVKLDQVLINLIRL